MTETYKQMLEVVAETTDTILEANVDDNQLEYLKTTKMLRILMVDEWMKSIQNINLHLVTIEEGARMLEDRELIKEVIVELVYEYQAPAQDARQEHTVLEQS